MTSRLIVGATALLLLGAAGNPAGVTPPAEILHLFEQAGIAYQRGQSGEAISLDARILAEGYVAKELFVNLADAYDQTGDYGNAILNYHRAWYLAPRDSAVLEGMQRTLRKTGCPLPQSRTSGFTAVLSREGWIVASVCCYWTLALILAAWIVDRHHARLLARCAVAIGLALCVSLFGVWQWLRLCASNEAIVIDRNEPAHLAPMDASKTVFVPRQGALVRITEKSGRWVKVVADGGTGWLPEDAVARVNL